MNWHGVIFLIKAALIYYTRMLFTGIYRGKRKVLFQVFRLDPEAGVGSISLYAIVALMFAAILVMNGSIVVGRFTGVM